MARQIVQRVTGNNNEKASIVGGVRLRFDRFPQAEAGAARQHGGLSLGLAMRRTFKKKKERFEAPGQAWSIGARVGRYVTQH
jgi:hypothetical protein